MRRQPARQQQLDDEDEQIREQFLMMLYLEKFTTVSAEVMYGKVLEKAKEWSRLKEKIEKIKKKTAKTEKTRHKELDYA
jgi:hypothetical protein